MNEKKINKLTAATMAATIVIGNATTMVHAEGEEAQEAPVEAGGGTGNSTDC